MLSVVMLNVIMLIVVAPNFWVDFNPIKIPGRKNILSQKNRKKRDTLVRGMERS